MHLVKTKLQKHYSNNLYWQDTKQDYKLYYDQLYVSLLVTVLGKDNGYLTLCDIIMWNIICDM